MEEKKKNTNINGWRTYVTHTGKFHADDVFSTAFIYLCQVNQMSVKIGLIKEGEFMDDNCFKQAVESFKQKSVIISSDDPDAMARVYPEAYPLIVRTSKAPAELTERTDMVVYDIGFGEYDHHQPSGLMRDNGIKYAAFGLLYKEFCKLLLNDNFETDKFESIFVQKIDESDNTGIAHPISAYISCFMPMWYDKADRTDVDLAFGDAVLFAMDFLYRNFRKLDSNVKAVQLCENSEIINGKGGKILILETYAPHNAWALRKGVSVSVYPSLRGGWAASVISNDQNQNICKFPKEWGGQSAQELRRLSGIPSLRFCHVAGFTVSVSSKEDAIAAAQFVVKQNV